MKSIAATAAAITLAGFAALPGQAAAQSVEIKDAVARVVVIVEDRADIGVEVERGAGDLSLTLERRGEDVILRGDTRGRSLRNCTRARAGATQPGDGASVEVRGRGRVALNDAPLVVLRTPRDVDVAVSGAVFGAVGRGAASVDLANAGCGDWTVANVDGRLEVSLAGSGDLNAGTAGELDLSLAGAGDVAVAPIGGDAEVSIAGSGDVSLASVGGDIGVSIAGSGNLLVRGGRSGDLSVSIAGSGDIEHRGRVGDVSANIVGSGDIRVASASGQVSRNAIGSGRVQVGS